MKVNLVGSRAKDIPLHHYWAKSARHHTSLLAPIQQLWSSDEKAVLLLSYSTKNFLCICRCWGEHLVGQLPANTTVIMVVYCVQEWVIFNFFMTMIICTLQGRLTRNCWSWVGKFCHIHHIAWTLPCLTIIYLLPPANFHCGGNCLATTRSWNCGWQFFTSKPISFFLNGTCV